MLGEPPKQSSGIADALGGIADSIEQGIGQVVEAASLGAVTAPYDDDDASPPPEDEEDKGGEDLDDLCSPLTIESYVNCRVRPLTYYLEDRSVTMARRSITLEMAALLSNAAGGVLSIADMVPWMPVTVAVANICMALTDYFYIPSQLQATNRALEQCHNLLQWWDSLSLVQRKRPDVKKRCCEQVEGSLLDMCTARLSLIHI